MTIPVVETERLILREWRDGDIDAYAAMNADPDVRRYMFPPRPISRAEAEAEIDRWEKIGFGHRPVVLKETGEVIGRPRGQADVPPGCRRAGDWKERGFEIVIYRSPTGT